MSKSWKKIIGYSLGSIIILLLAVWGILYWYVSSHKKEIIAKIEQAAGDKIEGKVQIKDIQPDFFKSFPLISFRLDSISLQDSLFHIYQTKLIEIEHAFVRLDLISVMKSSPSFSKVTVENGAFNIFIDTNGYSNNYLLKSKDTVPHQDSEKKGDLSINRFELKNCALHIDNKLMDKKFAFTVNNLDGNYKQDDTGAKIKFDIEVDFQQLGFNLEKGSFLKKAHLNTFFDVDYQKATKTFNIHKTVLDIDDEQVDFEAMIVLDKERNIPFTMVFDADKIDFNVGINWMSETIFNKLSKLKFEQPLHVQAKIEGGFINQTQAHVALQYNTQNNKVQLFDYKLEKVSFEGIFDNEVIKGLPRHDSNSIVTLDTLSADFSGLPIRARNISLTNFRKPFAKAELAAQFDTKVFNNFFGSHFTFSKGTASYDLKYNGALFLNTLVADNIFGNVNLNNFDFVYNERKLKFTNGNARLRLNGNDLYFDKFKIYSNNSDINITGSSKNFLTAFMELPGKAQMDLQLNSNNIDFGAFLTYFVQKRSAQKAINTGNAIKNASNKLDDFLSNTSINIGMDIQKAVYKKFQLSNLKSNMRFTESGIGIDLLRFLHADGNIQLKAGINQQAANNPFFAQFDVSRVKVDKFMYAMNNFGFKGLSDKNLNGLISLKGELKGKITDRGALIDNALEGKLNYELSNAALKNFSFFEKVKRFFKNRRLDNVEVPHFSGTISIHNGVITIPPTTLETSALNFAFSGKYGWSKGSASAMDLRVPLRNPQVDKRRAEQGKKKRKGEGIVLNFKATSDANGKINIGVGKTEGSKESDEDWSEEDE